MTDTGILMVIGAGRSGTSLFSRWLAAIGFNFGKDTETIPHLNPDGNFEDREFMKLHVDLLRANGYKRWLEVPLDSSMAIPPKLDALCQSAANRLNGLPSPAAVKNPLASSHLDYWHRRLEQPRYIFIHRDPAQMVSSVIRLRERNQVNRRNNVAGAYRRALFRHNRNFRMEEQRAAIRTWIRINDECIRFVEKLDPACALVLDAGNWHQHGPAISAALQDRLGYAVGYVDPRSLMKEGYFNREPEPLHHFADLDDRLEDTVGRLTQLTSSFGHSADA